MQQNNTCWPISPLDTISRSIVKQLKERGNITHKPARLVENTGGSVCQKDNLANNVRQLPVREKASYGHNIENSQTSYANFNLLYTQGDRLGNATASKRFVSNYRKRQGNLSFQLPLITSSHQSHSSSAKACLCPILGIPSGNSL